MIPNQNDELTKQIIELSKKHEEIKIEKLLEERLRKDPEDIEILFRLACLELYMPFEDYYACYICLEKIITICRKRKTLALSCITYIEQAFPSGAAAKPDYLYFVPKNAALWFYEVKRSWMYDKLINQLVQNGKIDHPEQIRQNLEEKLNKKPNDIEVLFLLSLVELLCLDTDLKKSVAYLKKIISLSTDQQAIATIFYAYVEDLWSGISEALVNELKNLYSNDSEINSMLKYASSLFYRQSGNNKLEEKYLKESIEFYQGHVWNYVHLARLYRYQGKQAEAKQLAQKAMSNVKKIYRNDDGSQDYDPTSINELLGQLVKGIYFSEANLEWIRELEK